MINGMPPLPKEHKRVGPIIGALVIILIVIIAALYFLGQRADTDTTIIEEEQTTQKEIIRNEATTFDQETQIELNADLDAQLDDVDYSF